MMFFGSSKTAAALLGVVAIMVDQASISVHGLQMVSFVLGWKHLRDAKERQRCVEASQRAKSQLGLDALQKALDRGCSGTLGDGSTFQSILKQIPEGAVPGHVSLDVSASDDSAKAEPKSVSPKQSNTASPPDKQSSLGAAKILRKAVPVSQVQPRNTKQVKSDFGTLSAEFLSPYNPRYWDSSEGDDSYE